MRQSSIFLRSSLFAWIAIAGCYSASEVRAQNEVVTHDLARARHDGAYRCAPRELATAEANLDFSNRELSDGHPLPAHDFSLLAQSSAKKALELSAGCGPKEVVIQEPPKDTDGDGVPDDVDRCPTVPGPKENFGCPWGDRDKDGIPDNVDKCPDVPGLPPDGCPPPPPPKTYSLVVVKKDRIEIKQQVHFATNKSRILPDSYELLGQVAQVLADNPDMKLNIEGHTDKVGSLGHNMKLSQARADSVMEYLIEHGTEAGRLSAEGFGPNRPIASNSTRAGKAQNRRVEFRIPGQEQPASESPPADDGAGKGQPLPPETLPAPAPIPPPEPAPVPPLSPPTPGAP